MNLLDENIPEHQRQLLRGWRISVRQIGVDVGDKGAFRRHHPRAAPSGVAAHVLLARRRLLAADSLSPSLLPGPSGGEPVRGGQFCPPVPPPPAVRHRQPAAWRGSARGSQRASCLASTRDSRGGCPLAPMRKRQVLVHADAPANVRPGTTPAASVRPPAAARTPHPSGQLDLAP